MQEHLTPPGDRELECALAGLHPAPLPDRRETIAYEAGRRSNRRPLILWRAASATLAAALFMTLFLPRPREKTSPIIHPPFAIAPPPATPSTPAGNSYLLLRDTLLTHGPDALPPPSSSALQNNQRAIQPLNSSPSLFGVRL